MKHTARLENWYVNIVAGYRLSGEIYDDFYGRFEDRVTVTTSYLKPLSMQEGIHEGCVVTTVSGSNYLLGKEKAQ